MGKRIVIMAGGTGGHVFPALAVATSLQRQGCQVSWIGTHKGLESRVVPKCNITMDWLTVTGLRGKGVMAKLRAPFMLLKACFQAFRILRLRRPDTVLGMGGFVAGPGGLMARLLGIRLIIHEQNRIPGTTNRLLSGFAYMVLEAFPNSFDKKIKAVCTGNPLRQDFIELAAKRSANPGSTEDGMNILIVGGSQGAKALNETVPPAMQRLASVNILHQTGHVMQRTVQEHYEALGIEARVVEFIEDMAAAYQWADAVIGRSGAMTISELAAAGLPSVLIPFPYAIDDHQTANARYLVDAKAAVMIKQDQLSVDSLVTAIEEIQNRLSAMSSAALACARLDATEKVAGYCMEALN